MRIGTAVWLGWAILVSTGCSGDDPPVARNASAPAAAGPSTAPVVATQAVAAPVEPAVADEAQAADTAQARRLDDARAYLEEALAAAQERQRLATLACQSAGQGDVETCLAAADDVLQNELQAARAEFEAQMRQPN